MAAHQHGDVAGAQGLPGHGDPAVSGFTQEPRDLGGDRLRRGVTGALLRQRTLARLGQRPDLERGPGFRGVDEGAARLVAECHRR
jgi:hypothetical protein